MELHHKLIGQGDPLVILHGLFGTLDNWQTLGRQFGEQRMSVLVDQRNHGKSPHMDTHSYPEMADDLALFLADNWMHEINLLGHSMGGKVAMQYALNYPDRVRKLIIVDMAPRQYVGGHQEIFEAMRAVPVVDGSEATDLGSEELSREDIDQLLAQRIAEPGVRMFLMKNLKRERDGGYSWKLNLDAIERDYLKILASISGAPWPGEALFVRGEKSNYVRDEDWAAVLALFPNAKLATIAGAGHWVHAEKPAELFAVVNDFLNA